MITIALEFTDSGELYFDGTMAMPENVEILDYHN